MRRALALVPVAALVLAGCASGPTESSPTATGTGLTATTTSTGTATNTSTTSASPTTSASSGTAAPTAASTGLPTAFTDVNQTITDADLGQSIAVKRIARLLPWPAGYNASSQAYELVAVEMTWTPSKTYTIPVSKTDFAITTGSQFPGAPESLVNATLQAGGWALLPDSLSTGDAVTGWMVFKVDPKSAPKLVLDYTRPASKVSGSSQTFPEKKSSITLVG